jgi:uncharacterized membrane protein/protein-disulfide isomerase
MFRRSRLALIIFSLLGLGASIAALYVHYQLMTTPGYSSFCDVSATVSCEQVLESQYGRVFGIPVAAGGAIWSALILLLAAFGMRETVAPAGRGSEVAGRTAGYIFILATLGLAAVFYFAYASFFVLRQACPLCMTMYASVIAIFLISATAAGSLGTLPSRLGGDLGRVRRSSTGATLAVVWLVASIALVAFFPREQATAAAADNTVAPSAPLETLTPAQLSEWRRWLDAQPRAAEVSPTGGVKVLVVKFNDFECPACRQMWAEYRGVVAKWQASHPAEVRFQNRDFPLEAECGFGGMHPYACEAAVAVRLAETKNLGDRMGDWLFENQASMDRDMIKDGLKQVAQITDFEEQYQKMLPTVRADAALGQKLGVEGTPTFFINGIKLPSLRPAYFDAAIAYELEKAGATS